MTGFLLMIIHKITVRLDFVSVLPLLLIILVFFFTFKYSIYERYKKLNKEIDEIKQLGND